MLSFEDTKIFDFILWASVVAAVFLASITKRRKLRRKIAKKWRDSLEPVEERLSELGFVAYHWVRTHEVRSNHEKAFKDFRKRFSANASMRRKTAGGSAALYPLARTDDQLVIPIVSFEDSQKRLELPGENVVETALAIYRQKVSGVNKGQVTRAFSRTAVQWTGAKAGALIGAKAGVIVAGPVGMAVGAVIGSIGATLASLGIYKRVVAKDLVVSLIDLSRATENICIEYERLLLEGLSEHHDFIQDFKPGGVWRLVSFFLPTEKDELRRIILKASQEVEKDLTEVQNLISLEKEKLGKLTQRLSGSGIFQRLMGRHLKSAQRIHQSLLEIFETLSRTEVWLGETGPLYRLVQVDLEVAREKVAQEEQRISA